MACIRFRKVDDGNSSEVKSLVAVDEKEKGSWLAPYAVDIVARPLQRQQ